MLEEKLKYTKELIHCWVEAWDNQVYVAFSGGRDSTALLHIVRSLYPWVPAVFCNTGLEFPEVVQFVKKQKNVIIIRPQMTFKQVIEKYGWPIVSKNVAIAIDRYRNTRRADQREYRLHGRWENGKHLTLGMIPKKWQYLINAPFKISGECCTQLKKGPMKRFAKKYSLNPMLGIMGKDSNSRMRDIRMNGCNVYDKKAPMSRPLALWDSADIFSYIINNELDLAEVYYQGYDHTGCIFCMFGLQQEQQNTGTNRFQKMKMTHPKLYNYCINKLGAREVLDFMEMLY